MFKNNKLFFWTVEILLVTIIIFFWRQMTGILSPFFSVAKTFFMPFVLAGFLYYITNPLVNLLEKRYRLKRVWGISLIFLILGLLVVYSITNLLPSLVTQLTDLINGSQTLYLSLQDMLVNLQDNPAFKDIDVDVLLRQLNLSYVDILKNILDSVTISVTNLISIITNVITVLIMAPIILFYFLKDGQGLLPLLERTVLRDDRLNISILLGRMNDTISHYISGVAIDAGFIFTFSFIGYQVMGIRFSFLFALIAAITNVIPYVGPYLGLIPLVLAYLTSDPRKMIIAIIYIMILQQIDGNIIYPRVVGSAMKIHPLTIMVLLLLGGNVYGLLGMLVAVPAYAIIKEIVKFAVGVYDYHKKNKIML